MVDIVINAAFGGFSLSEKACASLRRTGALGKDESYDDLTGKRRADPRLVTYVRKHPEEVGDAIVVTIPDGVDWYIEEYDGSEHVAECHRTWFR
jgi:hypothetical protein